MNETPREGVGAQTIPEKALLSDFLHFFFCLKMLYFIFISVCSQGEGKTKVKQLHI